MVMRGIQSDLERLPANLENFDTTLSRIFLSLARAFNLRHWRGVEDALVFSDEPETYYLCINRGVNDRDNMLVILAHNWHLSVTRKNEFAYVDYEIKADGIHSAGCAKALLAVQNTLFTPLPDPGEHDMVPETGD